MNKLVMAFHEHPIYLVAVEDLRRNGCSRHATLDQSYEIVHMEREHGKEARCSGNTMRYCQSQVLVFFASESLGITATNV